ncbi:transient receptor potential cation channel subfamily M member-like 2 [Patella vulgata]|uniref:transient receptor potential cation channel subfamily M member-like 2 n=1 Tax=Patella vulgata TaxID=6465 RepID=UPI0024A9190C|nr:transient receptor potential cation channel subfamily M member-like 2 [Patella vulgata]XP_055958035.1 transient receptor potential cation channel subfamily M member-like 2 [Patella vulgata]
MMLCTILLPRVIYHGFSEKENEDWTCIKKFFLKPVTIFCLNLLSYVIFLGLFSYLMVVSFNPTFSVIEIIICVWVFTLVLEEIRQCISSDSKGILKQLKLYLKDAWNKLDIITIILFLVGICLRLINNDQCFEAARVILCLDLVAFYVRLLHIFVVSSSLGPKLVMLRKMILKDLIPFMVIVLVFVLAYSVATEAILYPNTELSVKLLYQLPRKAYWHMYGELFLEDIEGSSSCTDNPDEYGTNNELRCPSTVGRYVAPVSLGIYMLFTNVLLLNILIAMFSNTFNNIEQRSYSYWCLQRYQLIYEYYSRPFLPPPLIVFVHLYRLGRWLKYKMMSNEEQVSNEEENIFKYNIKRKPSKKITRREKSIAKQCLQMHENERTKLQTSIQKLERRLETIENKLGQHLNRINYR